MRRPIHDMSVFRQRRQALAQKMKGAALILASHPEHTRNNDVHYLHRQDSNLFYLTGFEEPESILVFRPGQTPETMLFVRPKDVQRETWDGFRYGPEGTEREFGVDKAALISEFDNQIVDLLKGVDKLYYRWNVDRDFDTRILDILAKARTAAGRSGRGHLPVYDAWELLGEMRLFKSEHEVKIMRKACEITAKAHVEAMKYTRPGVNEREIQGVLAGSFYKQGADREGYNYIVATGNNATTLHYNFNDQVCKDGDLLLIDAGAEYQMYTGDITRTFPVNGKFTPVQKKVYQKVLDIQHELINSIKPGMAFKTLQDRTVEFMTDLAIELKLLSGSRQQLIDSLAYKKYYPHGVSHWLGMDVHDVGLYFVNGESRKLEAGMSFTVEPGFYIPADDKDAAPELRGIGVRIEDDIVVTATGCEVLTSAVPKEVDEMEAIIGKG